MKQLVCLLVLGFALTACSSNDSKAKKAVTEFLKTELDDFGRYEAVEWGEMDSVINVIENDAYYDLLLETDKKYHELMDVDNELLGYYKELGDEKNITDTEKRIQKNQIGMEKKKEELKAFVDNYEHGFVGWFIRHKYRSPNAQGALNIHDQWFFISKDFKKATLAVVE